MESTGDDMSQLSPISGSLVQTSQAEMTHAMQRSQEIRRNMEAAKGLPDHEDVVDIPIENTGELEPASERKPQGKPPKKQPHSQVEDEDEKEDDHIDMTA
ncbi:MAG: hypothetical protein ABSG31_07305 [Tepidisphaeraceae bacterium]|jgi:hypothetical protein